MGVVSDGAPLAEVSAPATRWHAASLPALVEQALARAKRRLEDVEAVAVSIGPGSFTGLRIGLALAKGIVFAGGLKLATVPTLEALAHAAPVAPGAIVCAALDARKQEVYAALFDVTEAGRRRLTPDAVLSPARLLERLPTGCVLVGDAAATYPQLGARARVLALDLCPPRGVVVARLGWARLAAGEEASPGETEPVYVRPSEAEINRSGSR